MNLEIQQLRFSTKPEPDLTPRTWFSFSPEYLQQLSTEFALDELIKDSRSELDKVVAVTAWVARQWEHDGLNEPKKRDPISILREVAQGQRFRCVEYSIVADGCLQALGIPTRVLALKTADVETRASGAGHVVLETFIADLDKWMFVDCQWNAIPVLGGVPVTAVELQQAIWTGREDLEFTGLDHAHWKDYIRWIGPYLFYFDISYGSFGWMLCPDGAKHPTVFQVKHRLGNMRYTNSLSSFYARPIAR